MIKLVHSGKMRVIVVKSKNQLPTQKQIIANITVRVQSSSVTVHVLGNVHFLRVNP